MKRRLILPFTLLTASLLGLIASRPVLSDPPLEENPNAKPVSVHITLLVSVRQPDGTNKETRLQAPIVSSLAGQAAKVAIGNMKPDGTGTDNATEVTPEINSDGTITLHVLWRQKSMERQAGGENTRTLHEVAVTRKVTQGKTLRVELEKFPGVAYCMDLTAEEMNMGGGGGGVAGSKQP